MALHRLISSNAMGCFLLVLTTCVAASVAHGATSTFVQNGTTWNGAANWKDGDQVTAPAPGTGGGYVPHLQGDVAIFQQRVTNSGSPPATYTISLGTTPETVGVLTMRDTDNLYTTSLTGTATLTFDNGASPAQLNEDGGTPSDGNASRLRITVPVQLNSDLVVTQNHNPNKNTVTEFAGQLSGAADITITKLGVGSLQMGYAGSTDGFFFGDVDIQVGELRIINPNAGPFVNAMLSKSKGVYVHDGTQLQIGNALTSFGLGLNAANTDIGGKAELVLEGIGDTSNPSAPLPEGALRFDHNGGSALTCDVTSPIRLHTTSRIYVDLAHITGRLTEIVRGDSTAGLNKGGNGVLVLAAANGNTYAGITNVTKGSLAVNNTVSTTSGVGTGDVTVNDTGNGANLGGTGYIGTVSDPSNVTLTHDTGSTIGAKLYPGDLTGKVATVPDPGTLLTSVGTLTIHGDLTFDSLSSLNVDLRSSGNDKVIDDGTITLGGAGLNFSLGTFQPTGTETYTLIDNQGASAISGVFGSVNGVASDYSEGATVTVFNATYQITYAGGTGGNDVVLTGTGVLGDYNNNGMVDAADYVAWRTGGPLQHEVDAPGTVNDQDYTEWRLRFGYPNNPISGSASSLDGSAVPEPATIVLLALISPFFAPLVARRKLGRTRTC